jgi:hypothetical protein
VPCSKSACCCNDFLNSFRVRTCVFNLLNASELGGAPSGSHDRSIRLAPLLDMGRCSFPVRRGMTDRKLVQKVLNHPCMSTRPLSNFLLGYMHICGIRDYPFLGHRGTRLPPQGLARPTARVYQGLLHPTGPKGSRN